MTYNNNFYTVHLGINAKKERLQKQIIQTNQY